MHRLVNSVMGDYMEYVQMLLVLGECRMNSTAAARLYAERFPDRHHPDRTAFPRLVRRAATSGRLGRFPPRDSYRRQARDETNIIYVLATVEAYPHRSIRDIARDTHLSIGTVWAILKQHRMRPYRISLHQALTPQDADRRIRFCHWAQRTIGENPTFFSNVLWTDESTFSSTGIVNRHNMHYWCDQNPHWMRQADHQHRFTVNVWCGIHRGRVLGPHFIQGRLTGETFNRFLNNELIELLEDIPLNQRNTMWFQLDGCPSHFSRAVRGTLREKFPGRCIGRGMDVEEPPRSPDLTVMDYYLWGRLKDIVYERRPLNVVDLRNKIAEAIQSLSVAEILCAERDFRPRLLRCINEEGYHFEHLRHVG